MLAPTESCPFPGQRIVSKGHVGSRSSHALVKVMTTLKPGADEIRLEI